MKLLAGVCAIAVFLTLGSPVSARAEEPHSKPRSTNPNANIHATVVRASHVQYLRNSFNPGVGLIPNDSYRAHFGQQHKFHLSASSYGHDRHFRYGGYSFGFADEWPTNWLASQDLFVVQMEGSYYLCNSTYPGVNIPLNIAQ